MLKEELGEIFLLYFVSLTDLSECCTTDLMSSLTLSVLFLWTFKPLFLEGSEDFIVFEMNFSSLSSVFLILYVG